MEVFVDGKVFRLEAAIPDSGRYAAAAQLAKDIYQENYGATIEPAPDMFLVCMDGKRSSIAGCAGLSYGARGALFSEQYLDVALDLALKAVFGYAVPRAKTVEVTSLATHKPHVGSELVKVLPILCWCWGMRAILCTATGRLQAMFRFHRLPFSLLARATPERITQAAGVDWGRYYATKPHVGVVRLDQIGHLFQSHCGRYDVLASPFAGAGRLAPEAQRRAPAL